MTKTNAVSLEGTLVALRDRAQAIPAELDELRSKRGPLSLQVAMNPSQSSELDALDVSIITMEREQADVRAAIEEAERQIGGRKVHGKIEAAKAAGKEFAGAAERVRAAYSKLAQAIDATAVALVEARMAEESANVIADAAVPYDPALGDDYHTGRSRNFTATEFIEKLVNQAVGADRKEQWTVSESLTDHVDSVMARVKTQGPQRVAALSVGQQRA